MAIQSTIENEQLNFPCLVEDEDGCVYICDIEPRSTNEHKFYKLYCICSMPNNHGIRFGSSIGGKSLKGYFKFNGILKISNYEN